MFMPFVQGDARLRGVGIWLVLILWGGSHGSGQEATAPGLLLGQPVGDYGARRERLAAEIRERLGEAGGRGGVGRGIVVLRGWTSRGEDYEEGVIRQWNTFAYLTGVEGEGAYLLMDVEDAASAVLYLPPRARERVGLNGPSEEPGPGAGAAEHYGIGCVKSDREFLPDLFGLLLSERGREVESSRVRMTVYTTGTTAGQRHRGDGRLKEWLAAGLAEMGARVSIQAIEPIVGELRKVKTPAELGLLERAIAITGEAQGAAARHARGGIYEYQLQARILQSFVDGGAERAGFASIVGSGPNSTIPHYFALRRRMEEGELVVVDIGAEYRYYTADITRTYPVSGRFTPRQREIYQLVLDAQRACEAHMKPGQTKLGEMTGFAREYFRKSPLRAKDKQGNEKTMDHFFIHGLGHYVGMEVHDPGDITKPVQVGEVFTIEPGIYIESEQLGVRIEDDYVMTEAGPRKLSGLIPSEPEAVEAWMREGRGVDGAGVPGVK